MRRYLSVLFVGAWLLAMPLALGVSLSDKTICSAAEEEEIFSHGTTSKTITKKMLKDTPPADYQVDMSMQADARDGAYDAYFLKDRLQKVSIKVDENNLNYLVQNADQKPTVMTDSVTIGDKTVYYTGLKTKGSYTLQHSYYDNFGSDRFSFTVNFGKYIKKKDYGVKQNFFGCRKISFNNFFFDKTMMKEYIALTLLTEMGLPTPQYGLTRLYINDKYYGVYFMVESLDQSILEQYGHLKKKEVSDYLLKPEHTSLVYDEAMDQFLTPDGQFDLSSVLKMDDKGVFKASGKLKDQDALWEEDEDTLQDVAQMLPTVFAWEKRINQLSEGKDFEGNKLDVDSDTYLELLGQIMNVDEVVRYFATHSFLAQNDNMFTGQKNYGLYVGEDGKCMVVPWDYDLSFGCYFPSTAETTANLDLDTMYRRGMFEFDPSAKLEPDEMYKQFPLFNVIFQNKSLRDKYHKYMRECAKIAVLGGTTFAGKSYEPGWFHSLIETIRDPLVEAASEELVYNAYYMNFIHQPSGVMLGLPNLSKIVAMRSVGVVAQVDGMDTTVCGYGCNLETLGNGAVGESSNNGVLTAVDDATGIYVTANYGLRDKSVRPPSIQARVMGTKENIYKSVKRAIGCATGDLTVYEITNTASAEKDYTLSIPVSLEMAKAGAQIYTCTDDGKTQILPASVNDNVYTVNTGSIHYIAVAKKGYAVLRIWRKPLFYLVIVAAALVIAVMVWVLKYRKTPLQKRKELKKKV